MSDGRGSVGLLRLCAAFAGWACVGALLLFGFASLLVPILAACLVAAAVLVGLLLWRAPDQWAGIFGLGFGGALVVGYIGWLNRDGPGNVCVFDHHGGWGCTDEWSPWPFYAVAAVMACASIGICAWVRRLAGARRVVAP